MDLNMSFDRQPNGAILHGCVQTENLELLQVLLSNKELKIDLNKTDLGMYTPIMKAVELRKVKMVETFFNSVFDIKVLLIFPFS